jgi:hypothetical protein
MLTAIDTDLPWLPLDLARGLDRLARSAGVAWLCARGPYRAVAVDAEAFTVESTAGNRLRIPRGEPGEGAVLAWALCR